MKGRPTKSRYLTYREENLLVNLLRAKKITCSEIAKLNGVTPIVLNKVVNGEYRVTPRVKEQFAKGGINLDEIMVDE